MIQDNQAGISCDNCGFEKKVLTAEEADKLEGSFTWVGGNPLCPNCGAQCMYEDYIVDDE